MELPAKIWHRLNFAWVAFFAVMGLINLWVAYSFSTSAWVNFKLFGALGLMLAVHGGAGSVPEPVPEGSGSRPSRPPTHERRRQRRGHRSGSAIGAAPSRLEVIDDSHLHAGHAGAREGRHFTVRITSARFTGASRVARHRLVYDSLRLLMPAGIHALAIDARAPDEAVTAPRSSHHPHAAFAANS